MVSKGMTTGEITHSLATPAETVNMQLRNFLCELRSPKQIQFSVTESRQTVPVGAVAE